MGEEPLKEVKDPLKSGHLMTVVNEGLVCNYGNVSVQEVETGEGTRQEDEFRDTVTQIKVPTLVSDDETTSLGMITRRINPTSYTSFEEIKQQLKPTNSVPFNQDFVKACLKAHCGHQVLECPGINEKLDGLTKSGKQRGSKSLVNRSLRSIRTVSWRLEYK